MTPNNICPDCKKIYDKMPTRCICGWYLVKNVVSHVDRSKCHYFENSKQCDEIGSVALRAKSHEWYCGKHAEQLREESYYRS